MEMLIITLRTLFVYQQVGRLRSVGWSDGQAQRGAGSEAARAADLGDAEVGGGRECGGG